MKQYFFCDDEIKELMNIVPELFLIMADMNLWAINSGLRFLVTSIIRCKDKFSESDTHQTGRAFDLSVKGWNNEDVENFILYFEHKYKNYAAITKEGGTRLILRHDIGLGDHIHVQVRRDLIRS